MGLGDRVFQWSSPCFDVSFWDYMLALLSGAVLILWNGEWSSAVAKSAGTYVFVTPSALAVLRPEDLSSFRILAVGGESVPLSLGRRWGAPTIPGGLWNCYGPTEATVETSVSCIHSETKQITIGPPLPNYSCYIFDGAMRLQPIGVAGELHIGGVGLAREYLNRPDLTLERFVPNPHDDGTGKRSRLYKTGDLAFYLPNGELVHLGRIDWQVKLRGQRVELTEIESAALDMPSVDEAAAFVHVRGDSRADG